MKRKKKCCGFAALMLGLCLVVAALPAAACGKKDGRLVAHRGFSSAAPENTLAAFRLAGRMGYAAIEFDLYPTVDGRWVVMHDDTVDRMTDKTGRIMEMTYAQTQTCRIDAGNGIRLFGRQKIPTLEQALAVCKKYGARPFIEIKGGGAEQVEQLAQELAAYPGHEEFVVISFDQEALCRIRERLPEITVLWLVTSPTEADIAECMALRFDGIDFNYKKTEAELIERIIAAPLIAAAWTCDSAESCELLYEQGVRYVTTNKILPDSFLTVRQ